MTTLKKGELVECIDDDFSKLRGLPFKAADIILPKKGERYRIRDVLEGPHGTGVVLEEIQNKEFFFDKLEVTREPVFSDTRFRHLDEKMPETKQDL